MKGEQLLVGGDRGTQLGAGDQHARFSGFDSQPFPSSIVGHSPRVTFLAEIGHHVTVIVHDGPLPRRRA